MAKAGDSARIVVIGGGVIGLSVAYHLGHLGAQDVLLLERHQLTSGTSWHAAGIVGPLRANMNLTKLAVYATELFSALEAETGQATGYRQTGGMWLARDEDRLTEIRRIAAMGELSGLDVAMLAPDEAREKYPLMRCDDLTGALWVEADGMTNPVDTCMALAKGARAQGVRIREHCRVTGISQCDGAVRSVETADGQSIRCDTVVICAGAWSRQLGDMAGVTIPLQAVEHMYVVTEPIAALPQPCPVIRDLEGRIYIKEDAGRLVFGGFEPDPKPWHPPADGSEGSFAMFPEDWDQFEPFMHAALNRIPVLEETGIQHFMNGPESFVPDTAQLMGEAPDLKNCYVAAGLNSIGVMSSAGVGKVLAEWIIAGEAPMDLWGTDIARADPKWNSDKFLEERIGEAVANQLEMHWPYKQMKTGRGLRTTPFHEAHEAAGAVFGVTGGWERPLWFGQTQTEREVRYSYGDQHWWAMADREAQLLSRSVGLIELTPFGKFDVTGADAERFLQRVCCNDFSGAEHRLIYTQMLNSRGGIEADVTVWKFSDTHFRVVGGAVTRRKDLMWLTRHIAGGERVEITDVTDDLAVLGVAGPDSRALLESVTCEDLSSDAFATSRTVRIASMSVTAGRMSFSGELGFELYMPKDRAVLVHDALMGCSDDFEIGYAGLYCLDACRMEKGFRHWGHDIGPDETPLEAGLGFAVAWDKPGGFIGIETLRQQRRHGIARTLVQFEVTDGRPLLLHDEPIYCNGALKGITTSGAKGFRTGKSLCFGYVDLADGETRADALGAVYEVGIAGERFPIRPLRRPPYDPDGARMRS